MVLKCFSLSWYLHIFLYIACTSPYISTDFNREENLLYSLKYYYVLHIRLCMYNGYKTKLWTIDLRSTINLKPFCIFSVCFTTLSLLFLRARKCGLKEPSTKENASMYFQPRTQPGELFYFERFQ